MGNCAPQKESDKRDNDNNQNMYASMACISGNDKISSRYFGDSSHFRNWVLYSGLTCHMKLQVSDFIPGLLEDTDKYIEVADGHNVKVKKKVQVQIKMWDNNIDTFTAIFHNILLAPDLCDRLF